MLSTVVAVALGIVPIDRDSAQVSGKADYSAQIGRYSQTVDRRGTTHLRGVDARGRTYELVMDRNGYVEANIGDRVISFRAQQQA